MASASSPDTLGLLHVWGPGLTPRLPQLLEELGKLGLTLKDLRQETKDRLFSAKLSLALSAASEQRLLKAAEDLGFHAEWHAQPSAPQGQELRVIALGAACLGAGLGPLLAAAQAEGLELSSAESFGEPELRGLKLLFSGATSERHESLRLKLQSVAESWPVDLAILPESQFATQKRLLCMDVDSTFCRGEFIDELAELAGVKSQVAEITARAMRGELDFQAALRERVRLLKGLPMSRAQELCDRYELSPGAEELLQGAKRLGIRVGLVSGGFDFFVNLLRSRYGLDFTFANTLEVKDGVLTGEVLGAIVDAPRKAQLLRDMAVVYGVHLDQTIAVGDGANDILMLKTAGLGVAYQAKPKLRQVADACLNVSDRLDSLLDLLSTEEKLRD